MRLWKNGRCASIFALALVLFGWSQVAEAVTKRDVQELVMKWRKFWEIAGLEGNIDPLKKFYHSKFYHPGAKMKKKAYMARLRKAGKKHKRWCAWLSDIRIKSKSATRLVVSFHQIYQRPGYRDVGSKQLEWRKEAGKWRIYRERWKATKPRWKVKKGTCGPYKVGSYVYVQSGIKFRTENSCRDGYGIRRGRITKIKKGRAQIRVYYYNRKKDMSPMEGAFVWAACGFQKRGKSIFSAAPPPIRAKPADCRRYKKGQRVKIQVSAMNHNSWVFVGKIKKFKGGKALVEFRYHPAGPKGQGRHQRRRTWFPCRAEGNTHEYHKKINHIIGPG